MKKRILIIIVLIMVLFTIIRTGIVSYTFLNFSHSTVKNEANLIKEILTEVIDKQRFLDVIKNSHHIHNIELINKPVNKESITFDNEKKEFTVIMPFNTTESLKIIFNSKEFYSKLYDSLLQILLVGLISMIVIIFVVNMFLTPYLEILENVKKTTNNILRGNFDNKIDTSLKGEAKIFVNSYNTFLKKLKESFGVIEEKYTSLIEKEKSNDPLNDAKETISHLANIFKFKRMIEEDETCDEIFLRLIDVLNSFNLHSFALIGIDNNDKKSEIIYQKGDICCNVKENFKQCRSYRLNKIINSHDYPKICSMHTCPTEYICIPFSAKGNFTGILKINIKENYDEIKNNLPYIKAYLKEISAILEAKYTLQILHKQTLKDPLTDTYNRRYLENILPVIINNADRRKDKIGFLMIDIDHFKQVNDTYGHKTGDEVLKKIAKIIKNSIRKSDILIRYGGEEFLVIVQNFKSEDEILKVAEKIRSNIEKTKIKTENATLSKTTSVGVCIYPYCKEAHECIKKADMALYEAKESGRNRVVTCF